MIRHFFLDKTNTIIEKSHQNVGLNPILTVKYGNGLMRGLIHFDIEEIKGLINDGTFSNKEKLSFTLNMTNCFSLADMSCDNDAKERATSFDLILFRVPCEFDMGRGYDYTSDFWINKRKVDSDKGSNWYNCRTNIPWIDYRDGYDPETYKGGVYDVLRLAKEYEAFVNGKDSIIVGTQHFDFGDENLCIDITKYVLDSIESDENFGLCLAFAPIYEMTEDVISNYVSFFTDHTNTFFHPFVEVKYDEYINDGRNGFSENNNRLYFYVFNEGIPCNLDKLPVCSIDDIILPVKQAGKGVYYSEISTKDIKLWDNTIYYDKWSELSLNGEYLDDVEMEFYVLPKNSKISIGHNNVKGSDLKPFVYGINECEELKRGEVREVVVEFIEKYSTDTLKLITNAKYRLYVKDGEKQINIINYHPIEMSANGNFFNIFTNDLIPNEYFVDIEIKNGREIRNYEKVLRFKIVDDITERYI